MSWSPAAGRAEAAAPERRCLVSRAAKPVHGLIRFVVSPDGVIVPDIPEKAPGRGLWLTAERAIVTTACRKGLFAKAARRAVTVSDTLADDVEMQLSRRCVELLSLARRAGLVAAGHQAVEAAAKARRCRLLFIASDSGGRDGTDLARRISGQDGRVTRSLSSAELGQALGRDMMVFVALSDGGLAERMLREVARLEGFRPSAPLAEARETRTTVRTNG